MKKILFSVFSIIFIGALYWFLLPPLNPAFLSGFWFFVIIIFIASINIVVWLKKSKENTYAERERLRNRLLLTLLVPLIGLILTLLGLLIGSSIFNDDKMRDQLGEVEEVEFEEMIDEIDIAQLPVVDEFVAQKIADKLIGGNVALGSRTKLGSADSIQVNGKIQYCIPLEFSGLSAYNKFKSNPGYIKVSASSQTDGQLVTEVDGKPLKIKYLKSAFGFQDLKRHIRFSGYLTQGLTEFTFETNDSGLPYNVVTVYKNETLWQNPEATGVIVCDAQNDGDIDEYSVENAPEWVDIIQPRKFIENQINNYGKYVHGMWLKNRAREDVTQKTALTLTVYVKGNCYYFTGMTSEGTDESLVEFMMVNTRNKKAKMCKYSGATEYAAMKSAHSFTSEKGYEAAEPLPIKVKGIPTYVLPMKDQEGLIKAYTLLNIEHYTIGAAGNTLKEAEKEYMKALNQNSSTEVIGSKDTYLYSVKGNVERISSVVEGGSTYFYMIIEGEAEKIFMASYDVSDELAVTREGDEVEISYIDDQNGTIDIAEFDNIKFSILKSDDQIRRDEMDAGTSPLDSEYNKIIEVDPEMTEEKWNSLSDEEKSEIIQNYFE